MTTQTQAERPAAPVIYTYDKTTGEYKPGAKAMCQWSPREKKWLIPAAATTTEPPSAGEKQAACYDAASKAWVLKADHRGEKWYDKSTQGLHEIKDIGVEPDETAWTQTAPEDLEAVWDEESSSWIIPTEVQERRDVAAAESQAATLLDKQQRIQAAQTMTFSASEFRLLAKAKYFDEWQPDTHYDQGKRLLWNGIVYEVKQKGGVDSLENYPPDGEGLLAVYRPLSVDSETGDEPDGTIDDPIPWVYGMDVKGKKYYSYEGKVWLCTSEIDIDNCTWYPGQEGVHFWEEIKTEE